MPEVGNNNPNTLRGTFGDDKGQDTLFGLGTGDTLIGRSAADQLAGGNGPDRFEGDDGNDTLVGGPGEDRTFTSRGFDFVFAFDGDRDVVNCNGQSKYRIVFDKNLDRLEQCPGANTDGKSGAAMLRGKGRRCQQSRERGVGRFHRDWAGVIIWAPAHLFLEPSGGRIVVRLVSERRR